MGLRRPGRSQGHDRLGVAEAGRSPGRVIGTLPHDVSRLLKALGKLGEPQEVHVVYEAGPPATGCSVRWPRAGIAAR